MHRLFSAASVLALASFSAAPLAAQTVVHASGHQAGHQDRSAHQGHDHSMHSPKLAYP